MFDIKIFNGLDLEERLYSKNTFLYEFGGLFNYIISLNKENKDVLKFDYYIKDKYYYFNSNGDLQLGWYY